MLSILLISCFGWYFLRHEHVIKEKDASQVSEEIIIPEHEAETGREFADPAVQQEEFKATSEPIRRVSTIAKGDSTYGILLRNSISHQQAHQILSESGKVFDLSKVVPGHELTLVFSPDNEKLTGLEYEISEHDRLMISIDNDRIEANKQHIEKDLPSGYAGPLKQSNYVVKKGDSLFNILRSNGVSSVQIDQVFRSVKGVYNLSSLAKGKNLSIWVTQEKSARLVRMTYEIDDLNTLEVTYKNGYFRANRETQELSVRYERAEGTVNSSLYESAVQAGMSPEVVMELTDIFAWDINFFTDVREGDSYTVLYERYYVGQSFKGYGRVIAARFINQGDEHVAVYYSDGKSIDGYYDEAGRPIQKLFLKAPLNYRRISSGFTYRRMHPIFHVMRPHLGVDYAAPSGTPVVALGDGNVIFKGWSKGFGKCIQLRHPSGYVTYYGHLSGFPKGVSKGSRVSQGEIVGFVGKTGYATGPHLDFRVRQSGRFLNPLTLKSVNGPPLRGIVLAHYKEILVKRLAMLDNISLNYAAKLSSIY